MPDAADLTALRPVVDAFHQLGIEFHVGGSVASNVHGVWRSTMDTDLVAIIRHDQVDAIVSILRPNYYVDASMIRDAITRRSSFNIIHNDTAQKIDIFIPKQRRYDEAARSRVMMKAVSADGSFVLPIASPEDTILNKLDWYKLGGETSQRQWGDIIAVMRVQQPSLDWPYLTRWAGELDVRDLLERARIDAENY